MKFKILDKNNKVVTATIEEWREWKKKERSHVVKQDDMDGIFVSTIFLHCETYYHNNDPLHFETMIFDQREDKNSFAELYINRYRTYKDALANHKNIVKDIKLIGFEAFYKKWCA